MKYANTLVIDGKERVVVVLPLDVVPGFDPENPPQDNTYGVPDDVEVGWIKVNGVFVKPEKTQAEIIAEYESALDRHLDSVARVHRFKDRHSLALRAGYTSPYQPLGTAFANWMDGCNYQAYQRLQRVIAGTEPMPTIEEFINDLPEFIAP